MANEMNNYLVLLQPAGTETVDEMKVIDAWSSSDDIEASMRYVEDYKLDGYRMKYRDGRITLVQTDREFSRIV